MSHSIDIVASEPAESFLNRLGERVRAARAQHGMTRRDLARHSEVSERHLAQLESGRGNISIVLLRQIAAALSTPVADLIRGAGAPDPERQLLDGLLDRLGPAQVVEARRLLEERFARASARAARLALIGLRGAGKSTIGQAVARRCDAPFVELADDIERLGGLAIEEIFEISGQAGFRRLERDALAARLAVDQPLVLATGGGLVSDPVTFQMLLSGCFTIWLRADPDDHMSRVADQGDKRPMAGNKQAMRDLKRILETRQPLYAQADKIVETSSRDLEDVLSEVCQHWQTARKG